MATLCNHGKRISQIASLNDEELRAAVLDYCADAHDYNSTVSALLAALLAFDEPALDRLFSEATRQLGFEEMMLRVAYPLLQRIGLLDGRLRQSGPRTLALALVAPKNGRRHRGPASHTP